MMYRILIVLLAAAFVTCGRSSDADSGDRTTSGETDPSAAIQATGFAGVNIGDRVADHAGRLTAYTLDQPGGSYTIYWIDGADANSSQAFASSLTGSVINAISVVSAEPSTAQGISIGSTWGEVQAAYPGIEAKGSPQDGRIYASAGRLRFRLSGAADAGGAIEGGSLSPEARVLQVGIQ